MAEETVQPDLYEIPEEELLKLMEQAKAAAVEGDQTQDDGQPRDEQGRFVKTEAEETEEVDEVVYRREIDLGDGSGKQVFEGASYDELIDKLATAQEHASRKIRELSAAKKPEVKEPVVDPNEDWLLSQELLTSPSAVIRKQIEKEFGKPLKEVRAELEEAANLRKEKAEEKNAEAFMASHPEFEPNKHNGRLMENYIRLNGLTGTAENIEKAFQVLSEGGLLQLKTEQDTEQNADEPTKQRIAAPAGTRTVVVQKKAASGLSAKRSTATPGPLTEQDLYDMPYDKFLELGGQSEKDNW